MTLTSILVAFTVGFVVSLLNGGGLRGSLYSGFYFSLLVGAIIAILSWAYNYAEIKGYNGWVGFLLLLLLNIIGLFILVLLPVKQR